MLLCMLFNAVDCDAFGYRFIGGSASHLVFVSMRHSISLGVLQTSAVSSAGAVTLFILIVLYCRHKKLLSFV